MKTKRLLALLVGVILHLRFAIAQPITSAQIDALVQRTLTTFDVPGIAVAIIKDGQVIHQKGYGVRSLKNHQPVDENTRFGIASNSKAFTAAALGILVDEGKISWDDPVRKHIPEFQMYNAYVTEAFTIRDLLTHRSGLGLGAGDLLFTPDSSDFTLNDVIHALHYLKPISGFRTKFDYDNLLYIVAGEVVARVSGRSWEAFVEERIMKPLQMNQSAGSYERLADKTNVIDAHTLVNGQVQAIGRDIIKFGSASGGINASLADMSRWIQLQLNKGKYGDKLSQQLFSETVQAEMWTPQTILPLTSSILLANPTYNTHFAAYGFGWILSDVKGYKQVAHTGALFGVRTGVALFPELGLGIIVLTNHGGLARRALINTLVDSYLDIPTTDWITQYGNQEKTAQLEAKQIAQNVWQKIDNDLKGNTIKMDVTPYVGMYRDPWFGDVVLSRQGGKTWFRSIRSPKLIGEVFPYKANTLFVKWKDRSLDADALLTFTTDAKQKPIGFKIKPISPLTDFSFDFQDLDLQRVKP